MKRTRKGFTLVELLVVIAIVAILATVAIIGYTSFVKKAEKNADQQAVTQMNSLLQADEIEKPTDIFHLFELFEEAGLDAEDYHPLSKDTRFYWDSDKNRILYTDANDVVIFPEDYQGETYVEGTSNWFSLTLEIAPVTVATSADGKYTVTSAGQVAYLFEQISQGNMTGNVEITVNGMLDMKGADVGVVVPAGTTLTIKGADNASGIKNLATVTAGMRGDGVTEGHSTNYNYGFIRHVGTGEKVILENLVFENIYVKDTNGSGVGLLIGNLEGGTAVMTNVTIKNSTVIGHRNTGALVGRGMGSLTLNGTIALENVQVKTVGGRSGLLMGTNQEHTFIAGENLAITITNSSYGIYSCEQNTGTYTLNGTAHNLGLRDGKLYSYTYTEPNEVQDKPYFEGAYATALSGTAWSNDTDFAQYIR